MDPAVRTGFGHAHNGRMRRALILLTAGAVITAVAGTGIAAASGAEIKPQATSGDVTQLIVTLVDDEGRQAEVTAAAASEDLPVTGVEVDDTQDLGTGSVRLDLTTGVSEADAARMIADIEADPRVASVEVDRRVYATAFPTDPPDDAKWTDGSLWGLYGPYGIGVASSKTSMNATWTSGQGTGTVVAVLDSGSTVHPDLDARYVAGYDFVSSGIPVCRTGATNADGDYVNTATYGALGWDSTPLDPGNWKTLVTGTSCVATDSDWHGTHVAGTIAAVGNNSIGVIGVAPQARIQPIRVLSFDGGSTSDIVAGINWAAGATVGTEPVNATPADVINMSLSGGGACPASVQAAIDDAVARGSVVIVSAGNNNADASGNFPGNCTSVITVASTDSDGDRSSFSNYGYSVDIAAPGSDIWSTLNTGTTLPSAPTYGSYNGTSMAAPHVSGVTALLMAANPTWGASQVFSWLQSTAKPFPDTGYVLECSTAICGVGLLRAPAAATLLTVSPSGGALAGGTSVTLGGANLSGTTAVTFGGTAATIIAATSTSVTVTTPARAAGSVAIAITAPSGSDSLSSAFTYHAPPTLTSLSPTTGTTSGGTSVTLTGTNLSGATAVTFDGGAATITGTTATSVTVTTPAHAAGAVDVVATTPGGSATLSSSFTYQASGGGGGGGGGSSSTSSSSSGGSLQEITEVRPAFGPVSGGNLVAIIGYGFTGATSVTIGGKAAAFRVVNDATVEVTMPAAAGPGSADVAVNLTSERGRAFAPGGYVYQADAPAAPAPSPPPSGAPASGQSTESGDMVTFEAGSSSLSASARTRLSRLAERVGDDAASGNVTVYSDARGSKASITVARDRARSITSFLRSKGVTAKISTTVDAGSTPLLRRSAVVMLSSDPEAGMVAPNERVRSLIVRYDKGVSPTVNGRVRGASLVAGGLGAGMTLGPNLGLRMYRVDFAQPVTLTQAEAAATSMMRDPGIEFAEPDRLVSGRVTSG